MSFSQFRRSLWTFNGVAVPGRRRTAACGASVAPTHPALARSVQSCATRPADRGSHRYDVAAFVLRALLQAGALARCMQVCARSCAHGCVQADEKKSARVEGSRACMPTCTRASKDAFSRTNKVVRKRADMLDGKNAYETTCAQTCTHKCTQTRKQTCLPT